MEPITEPRKPFAVRNFERYSDPEKLKTRYKKDPEHVNRRIAYLIRTISTLKLEESAVKHFFKVIIEAGLFSVKGFSQKGLPIMRSLHEAIKAMDSATALLLMENEFSMVTLKDLKMAMDKDLPAVVRAILAKSPPWLKKERPPSDFKWIEQEVFAWACEYEHPEIALQLILKGVNLDCDPKEDVETHLCLAASNGLAEVVYALILHLEYMDYGRREIDMGEALIAACSGGHLATAKVLIENGAKVDYADTQQRTPFHLAAAGQSEDLMKLLLDHAPKDKTFLNLEQVDGIKTALKIALATRNSGSARLLLEAGADMMKAYGPNDSALIEAAKNGMTEVMSMIWDRVPIEQRKTYLNVGSNSPTALCLACINGHLSCAERLVEWGADVMIPQWYLTPLHWAAQHGWAPLIKTLLNKVPPDQRKSYLEVQSFLGTAMQIACMSGKTACVKALLDAGANVRILNNDGENVFFFHPDASIKDIEEIITLILKTLLPAEKKAKKKTEKNAEQTVEQTAETNAEQKAKQKSFLNAVNKKGQTPVVHALNNKRLDIALKLIEAGADVPAIALDRAAVILSDLDNPVSLDEEAVMQFLYDKIPPAEQQQSLNAALIDVLSLSKPNVPRQPKIVKFLIEKGAQWNISNEMKQTPLHLLARQSDYHELIPLLLNNVPNPERKDCLDCKYPHDMTPLLYACTTGNWKAAEILIQLGADVTIGHDPFPTPLHVLLNFIELNKNDDPSYINLILHLISKLPVKTFAETDLIFARRLLKYLVVNKRYDVVSDFLNTGKIDPDSDMRFIFNLPKFSNLACTVHGQTFHLNTVLLNMHFKFFALHFSSPGIKTADLSSLIHPDNMPYFKDMLEFVYSGCKAALQIDHERFKGLACVADVFMCDPLKHQLEAWLLEHPECENWNELLKGLNTTNGTKRKDEIPQGEASARDKRSRT